MSGTSFDGLDVALCAVEGADMHTSVRLMNFKTVDYDSHFKEELKSVFSRKTVDLQKITLLNAYIGIYFGNIVLDCLRSWNIKPEEVDLIASHGQSIFHAPKWLHGEQAYGNATLQIGDGDHLATVTKIITLSDFRQKHIAAGGEGAPLAMYGDVLIFSSDTETRIMLNIGGIANFTFLPKGKKTEKVFSTDIGPGNTMIDQFVQAKYPGKYYDKDAQLALSGTVNRRLLEALLDHPFFSAGFPKTTGPELFNLPYIDLAIARSGEQGLSNEDILATLTRFSAEAIVRAIKNALQNAEGPFMIYLSGGGMHNPLLVRYLEDEFGARMFTTTESLGIDPDAKEAVLFALLANQAVVGKDTRNADNAASFFISMGKVSFPD